MTVKVNGKALSGKEKGDEYFARFVKWWESVRSEPESIRRVTHNYGKESVTLNKSALARIFGCDRKKFDHNSQIAKEISLIEEELKNNAIALDESQSKDESEHKHCENKSPITKDTNQDNDEQDDGKSVNAIIEQYKEELAKTKRQLSRAEKKIMTLQAELDKAKGEFKQNKLIHSALSDMRVLIHGKS